MQIVKIDEAKAGLVIAKDILDSKGNLLIKKETVLTDEILLKIKARNITHIIVDDQNSSNLSDEQIKQNEEEIDKALEEMFNGALDNTIMSSLMQAAKTVLKRRIK